MAKNDFGNFLGGLLNAVQSSYVSERDKSREQERALRDEARQEAVLSLQRLQNKQRVNEFNKSFEFQQNQTNVENVRNADKIRFDKLVAQKEMYKQYAPIESMPQTNDGFVFSQNVPGTIDNEFTKQSGSDVLDDSKKYYDVNAYNQQYDNYLRKMGIDIARQNSAASGNKDRIAVVHAPSGTVKLLKLEDYYKKVDEGYYPMDTWKPMTIEAASTYSMNQLGVAKNGQNLNQNSTPGQVADEYLNATSNSNMDWFTKQFTNQTDQTMGLEDILSRLKPTGIKNIENFNRGGRLGDGSKISAADIRDLKNFNNQKWTAQKNSNTQGIQGFIENTIKPLRNVIEASNNWKDTPQGREQRTAMELQIANLEEPLRIAYQGIDAGLINPSVKADVYNALQFAKGFARKNAVTLELMRRNTFNKEQVKQEVKSLTDK